MPINRAPLLIVMSGALCLIIGCSNGSTSPEPSSSEAKSVCNPQPAYDQYNQSGVPSNGQPPQNQSMSSAQFGAGTAVYTLQNTNIVKVWGNDVQVGDTTELARLLKEYRHNETATDDEFAQATALLVQWASNGTTNNGTSQSITPAANSTMGNSGFGQSANSAGSAPCY